MRYSTTTTEPPESVLQRAVEKFEQPSWGLRMTGRDPQNVRFEGPVGHIAIEVSRLSSTETEVLVETIGFDDEMLELIYSLPRRSLFSTVLSRLRRRM